MARIRTSLVRSGQDLRYLELVEMCVTIELGCDGVTVSLNDGVKVVTPDLDTVHMARGDVAQDVHLARDQYRSLTIQYRPSLP